MKAARVAMVIAAAAAQMSEWALRAFLAEAALRVIATRNWNRFFFIFFLKKKKKKKRILEKKKLKIKIIIIINLNNSFGIIFFAKKTILVFTWI